MCRGESEDKCSRELPDSWLPSAAALSWAPGERPLAVPGSPVRFRCESDWPVPAAASGCVQRGVEGAASLTPPPPPRGPNCGLSRSMRVGPHESGHSPGPLSLCVPSLRGMETGRRSPRGALPTPQGSSPVCARWGPEDDGASPRWKASVFCTSGSALEALRRAFLQLCRYGSSTSVPPFKLVLKSLKPDSRRI